MKPDTPEVAAARIEAERKRAELMDTARQLQDRLSPGTLAHNAWEGAKIKGADLAEDAVDTVRRHPGIASGVVAALTLFLAREPLLDLAGKVKDDVSDRRRARKSRKASKTQKDTETTQ